MEGGRLLIRLRAGNQDTICLHLSHGPLSHAQIRAASHQVINTNPGDTKADIKQCCFWFRLQVPKGIRICSSNPGRVQGERHSLWVQMGPSQPSLQTHVKDSPLTTQVPPLWQGLGRQLLFLAIRQEQTRAPSLRIQKCLEEQELDRGKWS
jgi:hypothetical protein